MHHRAHGSLGTVLSKGRVVLVTGFLALGAAGIASLLEVWQIAALLGLLAVIWLVLARRMRELFFFYVIFVFISPSFKLFGAIPFRIDDGILLLLMVVLLTGAQTETYFFGMLKSSVVIKLLLLIAVATFWGSAVGLFKYDYVQGFSDYMDYFYYIRLILVLLVSGTLFRFKIICYREIINCIILCLFLNGIVGLFQYFNLFNFPEITVQLYRGSDPKTYAEIMQSSRSFRRVFGTIGNPNYYGCFQSLLLLLSIDKMLMQRKGLLGNLVLALFAAVTFMISFSRTSLVALMFGLAVSPLLLLQRRTSGKWLRVILLGSILAVVVLFFVPDEIMAGFNARVLAMFAQGGAQLTSISGRIKMWIPALDLIVQSPLLGYGPANGLLGTTYDNSYLSVLLRSGVIGLLFWGVLGIYLLRWWLNIRRVKPDHLLDWLFPIQFLLVVVLYALMSDILWQMHVMTILLILVGALAGSVQSSDSREKRLDGDFRTILDKEN